MLGQQCLDIRQRHIFVQLDGQRLAVAAHGTDTHADTIDRDRTTAAADDLVGLSLRLPLFTALTVSQLLVDPRDQAAGQRYAEVVNREGVATQGLGNSAVDVQNGTGRVRQLVGHGGVDRAHLADQLAHVLGTGTTGCLIGHGAHPLDETLLKQPTQPHQHQADGAVTAHVGFDTITQRLIDITTVDRVQHDDGLIFHAQRGRSIDPVTFPALGTQLGVHLAGVITALTGNDDVHRLECFKVKSVLERRNVLTNIRTLATYVGGGKKHRIDIGKIILVAHALHQHRADHATPTNQTNLLHNNNPRGVTDSKTHTPGRGRA